MAGLDPAIPTRSVAARNCVFCAADAAAIAGTSPAMTGRDGLRCTSIFPPPGISQQARISPQRHEEHEGEGVSCRFAGRSSHTARSTPMPSLCLHVFVVKSLLACLMFLRWSDHSRCTSRERLERRLRLSSGSGQDHAGGSANGLGVIPTARTKHCSSGHRRCVINSGV
jgi:hypothetical protein